MRLFDAEKLSVIFKQLSLVEKLVKEFELLAIRHATGIYPLIDIGLPKRYIAIKINQIILINVIIHFVIHSFYDMGSDQGTAVRQNLVHVLLNILLEVPCHDEDDVLLMVYG